MLALTLAPLALAAEELPFVSRSPLRWSPRTDVTYRYAFESDLKLGGLGRIDLGVDADCRVVRPELERFGLACVVTRTDIIVSGVSGAEADALDVAAAGLENATIAVSMSRAGRLLDLDVEPATGSADELTRRLARRALAGFDLELPANPLAMTWSQRRTAFQVGLASDGPLGRAELFHIRTASSPGSAVIETMGETHQLFVDAALRPIGAGQAAITSVAEFDSVRGLLSERVWHVEPTRAGPYEQTGHLELVDIVPTPTR